QRSDIVPSFGIPGDFDLIPDYKEESEENAGPP
ncbi:MAG: hypothetical protein UX30_C0004G0057, partial [Candidatus Saccharibacteria bacterium GW2011_GWA2_46_10]